MNKNKYLLLIIKWKNYLSTLKVNNQKYKK